MICVFHLERLFKIYQAFLLYHSRHGQVSSIPNEAGTRHSFPCPSGEVSKTNPILSSSSLTFETHLFPGGTIMLLPVHRFGVSRHISIWLFSCVYLVQGSQRQWLQHKVRRMEVQYMPDVQGISVLTGCVVVAWCFRPEALSTSSG